MSQTFNELKRNLKKDSGNFKKVRLAILADSASQLVVQAIKGYGIAHSINFVVFEADYNQIDRQVFDPGSDLYKFEPEFLLILRSTERLNKRFCTLDRSDKESFANNQLTYLISLCQQISSRIKCKIILNNYIELNDSVFGNLATKVSSSFLYQVRKLNLNLMDHAQENKLLFLLDLNSLIAVAGYRNTFDPKMYYSADMVFNIDFLPNLAKHITDIIFAISGSFKKCVVLDLDNTIWGGVIGDDGVDGIQIGDLGHGKIFSDLQLWVKQLKQRGIIVAICSKNTSSIAKEPFLTHPEMVLRLEDIAVFVANWENKADNIRHIQSVLNIGMDSIVFIDDNPFERELVKKEIPEIMVPDLPEDPADYLLFLKSLNMFEIASFTVDDEQRTLQYQQEAERSVLQQSFANEEEFLSNLEMVSEVKAFDTFTIPRVSQLSQRSNQFNLRTIRYTETELLSMVGDGLYYTYSFTLKDKYGENGLIAFVVLKQVSESTLFIENWAMSCRVLKRGMEFFTLDCIAGDAKRNGYSNILAEYLPTKKNMMVKAHYSSLGFEEIEENSYVLNLATYQLNKPVFITRM
ncbi:HAD-IIIC family phosphatase [Pedobacter psychroterrae]|uniref:HAD-IIIC family phosphatase n=1 Tax=Pedobacter psychroterrae TaxID=2530453 RepID=A0A4R0N9J2_9SPHI|nr:HAD-IIIC family phosphatase [Pedobacter psychroterrae]